MTKFAYFDCPTGIAGDMCLGALVDAGVPLDYLETKLAHLGIAKEYQLECLQIQHNGQRATKIQVHLTETPASGEILARAHNLPVTPDRNPAQDSDSTLEGDSESLPTPAKAHTHHHGDHFGLEQQDDLDRPNHLKHHSHHGHHKHHSHGTEVAPSSDATTASKHDHDHHHHHHGSPLRRLPDIEALIHQANLPDRATAWSLAVFRQLAQAEANVHGLPIDQVHFHEVGATDAIVDIVGTCLGLDWLGIDQIYCAALPIGGGTVWAAHGRLPVPAPAVLKLMELRGVPLYDNGIKRELVTPTGAAIVTTLATHFGSLPTMTLRRVGLGAGSRSLPIPNILRLWLGDDGSSPPDSWPREVVATTAAPQPETASTSELAKAQSASVTASASLSGSVPAPLGDRHQPAATEAEVSEISEIKDTEIVEAEIGQSQITDSEITHSQVSGCLIQDAEIHKSQVWNAEVVDTKIRHSQVDGAVLQDAVVKHTCIYGSELSKVDCQRAEHKALNPKAFGQMGTVMLLETQVDDLNPQAIGYLFDQLLQAGALDLFTQGISMKKSRPGLLLSVICRPDQADACEAILFRETTTLGIRHSLQTRRELARSIQPITTPYGMVRLKLAWAGDPDRSPVLNAQPEYEDCAQIAREQGLPWREVHQLVLHTWANQREA